MLSRLIITQCTNHFMDQTRQFTKGSGDNESLAWASSFELLRRCLGVHINAVVWGCIVHVLNFDCHIRHYNGSLGDEKSNNLFLLKLPTASILERLRDFHTFMIQDTANFTVCIHFNVYQRHTRGVTRPLRPICSCLLQLQARDS